MQHCLAHVPGSCFTLGPDHGRSFLDAPAGFTQVSSAADERNGEFSLFNVEFVRRSKHLRLVHHIHSQCFQNLGFHEVADPGLGHNGDGHSLDDRLYDQRVCHPGHATHLPDVRRHGMQSHYGHSTRFFSYYGLFRGGDVHYDAAFLHLCETAFEQFRTKSKIFQLHELPQTFLSAKLTH